MNTTHIPHLKIHHFSLLWNWLTNPSSTVQDAEQRRKSQALATLQLVLLPVVGLVCVIRYPLHPTFDAEVASQLAVGLFMLAGYVLSRHGQYQLVSLASAVLGSAILVGLAWVQAGPEPLRTLDYLVVMIVISSLFLSVRLTLLIFVAQMLGLVLWSVVAPDMSFSSVLEGPFVFNLTLAAVVMLVAFLRDHLEADRRVQLAASEVRYRSLVTALSEGIVFLDKEAIIQACNPAAERILGLTADQMLGRTPSDPRWQAIHEDGTPFPGDTHPSMITLRTGQPLLNVVMGVHKPDGSLTWLSINSQPLIQPGETVPYAVVVSLADVTDHKGVVDALRDSETRFRGVIEQAHEGISLVDEQGRIVGWNQALEKITAIAAQDASNKVIWDMLYQMLPEAQQTTERYTGLKAGLLDFLRTGQSPWGNQMIQREYRQPNGITIIVEGRLSAIQTAKGFVLVSIFQDITARKQAEVALQESEERYRRLIETSPDGVLVHQHGTFVFANPAALALYGAATEDMLLGKPALNVVHPEYQAVVMERIQRLTEAREHMPFLEQKHVRLDGSVIEVEVAAASFALHGELAVQTVVHDITKHKRMAELLTQERNLLRTLIDNLPDYIYIKDMASRFMMTNTAHLATLGVTSLDDAFGKTDFDFFPHELAVHYYTDEQAVMQSGQPLVNKEELTATAAGQSRLLLTTKRPLRNSQGEIVGIVGISRDITERKEAEQQALELTVERQRVKVLETFIQDASHDLRTPLSVIQLSVEALLRYTGQMFQQTQAMKEHLTDMNQPQLQVMLAKAEATAAPIYKRIENLESSSRRLDYVVNSLLEVTRLEHQPHVNRSMQDLNRLVHELITAYQPQAVGKEQVLEFEPDEALPHFMLDGHNFPRVIQNLLANAVQYTQPGGKIQVKTYQHDRQAVLEVRDTGIGIAAPDLPHIFERFYRVDKARPTDQGGAGVGLAIAKHIVEAHGGSITVESVPDKGSTFRVVLPLGS